MRSDQLGTNLSIDAVPGVPEGYASRPSVAAAADDVIARTREGRVSARIRGDVGSRTVEFTTDKSPR